MRVQTELMRKYMRFPTPSRHYFMDPIYLHECKYMPIDIEFHKKGHLYVIINVLCSSCDRRSAIRTFKEIRDDAS